jgi:hypothetical protein
MHDSTMTVTVGLDVQPVGGGPRRRVARGGTLPDDHEAVERALRRWPVVWAPDRVRSAGPRYATRRWRTAPLRLPAVSSTPIARRQ